MLTYFRTFDIDMLVVLRNFGIVFVDNGRRLCNDKFHFAEQCVKLAGVIRDSNHKHDKMQKAIGQSKTQVNQD